MSVRDSVDSRWRWFPAAMIGALLAVVAVNAGMIYAALRSFPGSAGQDGFDLSNGYGRILASEARQTALGWHIAITLDGARPVIRVADRDGAVLSAATVDAVAERPLGPPRSTAMRWKPLSGGAWRAGEALDHGQWIVLITVRQGQEVFTASDHLIVP